MPWSTLGGVRQKRVIKINIGQREIKLRHTCINNYIYNFCYY